MSRGRERHTLDSDIWADTKQQGVPYARWIAWFVQQPPLRAIVADDEPDVAASVQRREIL